MGRRRSSGYGWVVRFCGAFRPLHRRHRHQHQPGAMRQPGPRAEGPRHGASRRATWVFCVGSEPNRQGELAEKSPIGPLGNFEVGKTRDYVVLLDAGTGARSGSLCDLPDPKMRLVVDVVVADLTVDVGLDLYPAEGEGEVQCRASSSSSSIRTRRGTGARSGSLCDLPDP